MFPDAFRQWKRMRKQCRFQINALKIFTGRNEVVAKVMFLHVSVILLTGGKGVSGQNPPRGDQADTPPGPGRHPPGLGRPCPPRQGETTPPGRRLQHTVNERPVRILLECILVNLQFTSTGSEIFAFAFASLLATIANSAVQSPTRT